MKITNPTPEKRVAKTGKKVDKALGVFNTAVSTLDKAADEQLAAATAYAEQSNAVEDAAYDELDSALDAATDTYNAAIDKAVKDYTAARVAAHEAKDEGLRLAVELAGIADDYEDKSVATRQQADAIRVLLPA